MMHLAPGKAQLYDRLRYDVVAAGGQMLLLSITDEWPQVFSVTLDDASARIRVYLWHLTHDTARDDYKFQLTGVSGNRFIFETGVRTIILGYYDAMRVYLAADSTHRTAAFGISPAIQVRQKHLESANRNGFCAFTKTRTNESVVVVRHDFIATYLTQAASIHAVGELPDGVAQLNGLAAAVGEPRPVILKPRGKAASIVLRSLRRSDFSNRIMAAYQHRCCACELQLELVDAAHIVPVGAAMGSDDTRNGLALCRLHHKAYDDGLLGIFPDYSITISKDQVARLDAITKLGGLPMFQSNLRSAIALPYNRADHPDPQCLRIGLEARNWKL
jgi:putative restriction endonuclease